MGGRYVGNLREASGASGSESWGVVGNLQLHTLPPLRTPESKGPNTQQKT